MISKSGRYWSTGINVTYAPSAERINGELYPGWHACLDYQDDGFADNDPETERVSTEGKLFTRYPVRNAKIRQGLSIALDTLIADAERLGVTFTTLPGHRGPNIFYDGDGENEIHPAPEDFRDILATEADRLGWSSYTVG